MPRRYLVLLHRVDVSSRLLAVFVSAVTLGMMSLTVVLCVRQWSGSFALAGAASGLFSLGNAVGIAWQGRLLDRPDARAVVGVAGSVCVAATGVFVVAGSQGAPVVVPLVAVTLAGAAVPAVTAAVRAWLPRVLAETELRTASYALLSVVFQAAVALGPLVVSLCVLLGGPTAAAVVAAALIGLATGLYVRAARPAAGTEHPGTEHPATRHAGTEHAGWVETAGAGAAAGQRALTGGLVVVLAVTALTGAGFGSLVVTLPALMTERGTPAVVGVLFAAVAVGEVCGALAYGTRAWPGSRQRQMVALLLLCAVTYAAAVAVAASTTLLLVALLACGAVAGPVSILLSALIDDVAPAEAVARSYALLVTTTLVAVAAGSAAAGLLADLVAPVVLLPAPAVVAALAAVVTVVARRSLRRRTGFERQ